jgi:hypothetical protein
VPFGDILFKDGQFPVVGGHDTRQIAREAVRDAMLALRQQCSIQEDEALVGDFWPVPGQSKRTVAESCTGGEKDGGSANYVMAALAAIRMREKQILGRNLRLLEKF